MCIVKNAYIEIKNRKETSLNKAVIYKPSRKITYYLVGSFVKKNHCILKAHPCEL